MGMIPTEPALLAVTDRLVCLLKSGGDVASLFFGLKMLRPEGDVSTCRRIIEVRRSVARPRVRW
jgi:hypothetical protein